MEKGAYIAIGFVPTLIALYILLLFSLSISHENYFYYFVFISLLICLPTGIFIKKKGYKNIGTGVIGALISFYLFLLMLHYMMLGPM